MQAILKTNKWRAEYGVVGLSLDDPAVKSHYDANRGRVLRHRDMSGRPVIYIPARNHNANDRDVDELTKFIVYCLVSTYILSGWGDPTISNSYLEWGLWEFKN